MTGNLLIYPTYIKMLDPALPSLKLRQPEKDRAPFFILKGSLLPV
jgi:hypothetical protein